MYNSSIFLSTIRLALLTALAGPVFAGQGASATGTLGGRITVWGNEVVYPLSGYGAKFTQIATGRYYNLALTTEGKVVAWGDNLFGQCYVPEDLQDVIAVAGGNTAGVALKADRTVVSWGGDVGIYWTPMPADLTNVVAIAAGCAQILALKGDGTIAACGGNCPDYGDMTPTTVPSGLTGVVAIAARGQNNAAVKADGTVVVWGTERPDTGPGIKIVPEGLTGVTAISLSITHALALKADGTIVAWGDNSESQCNVPVGLGAVRAIAAGTLHSVALKADGTVLAWGANKAGQCDVPDGLHGVIAIAADDDYTIALTAEGNIVRWGDHFVRWGDNSDLSWALNNTGVITDPSGFGQVVAVAANWYSALALKADGTVSAFATINAGQYAVPAGLTEVKAIAESGGHSLALREDGTVVAWGSNGSGQCNVPSGLNYVVGVTSFGSTSVALKSDGTIRVWGMQNDDFGSTPPRTLREIIAVSGSLALKADGTVIDWAPPGYWEEIEPPSGLTGVVAIAAGSGHRLALKVDGTVVAWGENSGGECDVPSGTSDVVSVAAGAGTSLALRSNGDVVNWGSWGRLRPGLVPAGLPPVTAIAAGYGWGVALFGGGESQPPVAGTYEMATSRNRQKAVRLFELHRVCSDPDWDSFIITAVSPNSAAGGGAQISGGSVIYNPPTGFVGADSFTYTVRDSRGASSQGTVQVTVSESTSIEETIPTLFNTGTDASRSVLPDGMLGDPHYALVTVPGDTAVLRVRTSVGGWPIQPGFYNDDDSLSAWIGPNNDASVDGPVGAYVYRTTFDLCGFDPATAHIAAQWSTDNESVDILLNGTSIGNGANSNEWAFQSWTPFDIADGFAPGVNTLDFIVHNDGGPTSLRVEMNGTALRLFAPRTYELRVTRNQTERIPASQLQRGCNDSPEELLTLIAVSPSSAAGGNAQITGSDVIYTPPHDFLGVDSFTYTVRNGQGATAQGVVKVTVQDLAAFGDLNHDGCIDRADLALLMSQIQARSKNLTFDLNADGKVDIADARFLVLHFTNPGGSSCQP